MDSKKSRGCQAQEEESRVTNDEAPKGRKDSDEPCVRTGLHPEGEIEGFFVGGRVHGDDVVIAVDGEAHCFQIRLLYTVQFPEL